MELVLKKAKELVNEENFLSKEKTINDIDGIKIQAKDSWVHIRKKWN